LVNPNGTDATVTATCTGGPFTATSIDGGSDTSAAAVQVDLTGLTRSTAYSCAIAATNVAGATTSATPIAFTTANTVPPNAPPGTTSSKGATSTDPHGAATAKDQGVSATGAGAGSLTVAQYPTYTRAIPEFYANYSDFDVAVDQNSTFTSVTITDTDVQPGDTIYWYNGNSYQPVNPQSFVSGPPATITMTLSATSSPSISQLTGTIFAVAPAKGLHVAATKVHATRGHRQQLTVGHVRDADNAASRTFHVTVAWGDGTHSTAVVKKSGKGGYTLTGTHRYRKSGTYRTTVTVTHRGHRAHKHGRVRVS
jgi:hypothetical protein